ncbi:MAG: T9SS type A sorting domain-containing protein [Bacteroidales bacterium]|nr:T9SS type A sorting domain-containing protein [Bacteroidales bacterium]
MKKNLLFVFLIAAFVSMETTAQTCGRISLIGEFNGWSADHFMTRNPESPAEFSTILILTDNDDVDTSGFVEVKFRENADWAVNWGGTTFPAGTGVPGGDNILLPVGSSYLVSFNCVTLAYEFQSTCGVIGLIGEFNSWSSDLFMVRDAVDPDTWTVAISVSASDDIDSSGFIDMKFRENSMWSVNWGSSDFPTGTAVQNGPDIPVPEGSYLVTFNCATGVYNFVETCGMVSLIGEFNNWSDDHYLTRDAANPDLWTTILTLTPGSNSYDPPDIIHMKFRENADWTVNWGSDDFPSGIATQGGPDIPVPLDVDQLTTDYKVTFNCATGEFSFTPASGAIGMIGAFIGWQPRDIPMNRDAANPNLWHLSRSWYADSEVKFRENMDWTVNWGGTTFPSGTGIPGGDNIPLVAGKYDVTFNATTLAYSFVPNPDICGEIGLIGDFNTWGDDGSGVPTDVWMVRDPMYPSQFTASVNFTSSTELWFRLDADPLYNNVWGGTFPEGNATVGGPYIQVPGGSYDITFNCQSGDFKFTRLGSGVTAPKVFAISVDGILNEADWKIDQVVSKVIEGDPGDDLNEVYFGVAYNDEYLYVGLQVKDALIRPNEMGEVFIDGNKSGGPYDDYDLHLRFGIGGLEIIHGPDVIDVLLGFQLTADGYTAELGIPWAALDILPEEGGQIGFDLFIHDDDTGLGVDYILAWNGGLQNYNNTSSFGDLLFGTLSCGCISLYNNVIGDVVLRNPSGTTTYYTGTYELFDNQDVMFRKDMSSVVNWANDAFPTGTAVLDGPAIPATAGRYRIGFDCITGEYTFTDEPAHQGVAYAQYTTAPPTIDGDLSEYSLDYGSEILAAGNGPINNTVSWGTLWDENNLYIGVKVVDAVVEGSGNPWDNDAVEFYIDGDNSKDGAYDAGFDTQLIMDALNLSELWVKADGVPVPNEESIWLATSDGYIVELRLGWDNFSFNPGRGRTIGWSLGNNDSDNGIGRDYQSVWYGTGNNWSNTADLGDLQLAGGPYFFSVNEIKDFSSFVVLYPNPASGNVYLRLADNDFNQQVTVYVSDIAGRTIVKDRLNFSGANDQVILNVERFTPGIYFVNIIGDDGNRAVKKLIVR